MRIDKFLKNSRIIKRRTVAKTACETGRVKVNSQIAKPGTDVNIGDIVEVAFGDKAIKVKVLELIENTSKLSAEKMFKVIED
ncbi:RNA-binding S4 domain-containing protein [uncultured Helcococcus sp.]|uniref:RNA-binding S4 domain-containing protein n=1 Tax=uncultured Helcococcus sp. TaxID=1072508 RepID=UPI00288B5008|nr:RNA-binding S4 domain-containing protein [uncultured Helcococcus sp.]